MMQGTDLKTSYGAGTAFTVLDHTTAIALGTTTPSLVLGFGRWLVSGRVVARCVGATLAGTETLTVAIKDASSNVIATTTVYLPVLTASDGYLGSIVLPVKVNDNGSPDMTPDTLVIHASLSADPGAGSVQITEAELVAIKLF